MTTLTRALSLSWLVSWLPCASAWPAPVPRPVVEQTGADTYVIRFEASAADFPVQVFVSAQPGGSGAEPIATAGTSPVEVTLAPGSGRPFFRLVTKSGQAFTVSTRRLPLDGAPNFRDLGGYQTADGHHVQWGVVYRSGQLAGLTEGDYRSLASLGIRLVCDFRVDAERQRSPTVWQGASPPEIWANSVDTVSYFSRGSAMDEHMRTVYGRMPFDASAQYGALLQRIVKGDVPLLLHCTAGKDRTGFFSALLLTLLGVPHETVVADFVLTNEYIVPADRLPQMAKDMQARMHLDAPPDADTVRAAVGVLPSNLEIGFRVIREKYGSVENYAREALKLSDADMNTLRTRLLE